MITRNINFNDAQRLHPKEVEASYELFKKSRSAYNKKPKNILIWQYSMNGTFDYANKNSFVCVKNIKVYLECKFSYFGKSKTQVELNIIPFQMFDLLCCSRERQEEYKKYLSFKNFT